MYQEEKVYIETRIPASQYPISRVILPDPSMIVALMFLVALLSFNTPLVG